MTIAKMLEFLRLIDYWAHRLVHLTLCLFFFFKPVLVGATLVMALLVWAVAWVVGRAREEPGPRPMLATRSRRSSGSPRMADIALVAAVFSIGVRPLAGPPPRLPGA